MSDVVAVEGAPSFREAARYWLLLGWINFGGPAGQIALMHRDLVERKRWISEGRFLHALNFCMLLPGPEAKQLAIYVGWLLHGLRGALVAGVGFVLPSAALLWGLAWIYVSWGTLPAVTAVLAGIKPVVVAIVAEALLRIGARAFRHAAHGLFAAAAFAAIFALAVPFPAIVAGAALAGLAAGALLPGFAPAPPADESTDGGEPPPRRSRPLAVLAAGLALWALPFAVVLALAAEAPVVRDVYLFFTRAAFVTFGGAYAVLAYVAQVAVEGYGWLAAPAMIDGLALAESTPGPLIVVVQFVGFLAGWNHPGALAPLAAATLAALATSWVTFLPSFLFILLGAPHVERLRARRGVAAALTGVTAAVVGVILNLGVIFGRAVLFPTGALDPFALAVTLAALVALARFRLAPQWVVLAGAMVGLLPLALSG